jgi:hypothetical protein
VDVEHQPCLRRLGGEHVRGAAKQAADVVGRGGRHVSLGDGDAKVD